MWEIKLILIFLGIFSFTIKHDNIVSNNKITEIVFTEKYIYILIYKNSCHIFKISMALRFWMLDIVWHNIVIL